MFDGKVFSEGNQFNNLRNFNANLLEKSKLEKTKVFALLFESLVSKILLPSRLTDFMDYFLNY